MKETLARGEDLLISGFGKFTLKEKKLRRGRNPRTGDDIFIRPHKVVGFKAYEILRSRIKGSN